MINTALLRPYNLAVIALVMVFTFKVLERVEPLLLRNE